MSPITIDVFSEGKTEKTILQKLQDRGICPFKLEERGGGGDPQFLDRLRLRLKEWFELLPRYSLRILVLRDLDAHKGRTINGLCNSVLSLIHKHEPDAIFVKHPQHENVFKLQSSLVELSLTLHIASPPYTAEFAKSTIDDYALNLALRPTTAESLLRIKKDEGLRQEPIRHWTITPDKLISKVWQEIPHLLQANQVPALLEAKEFLRFYSAVLQEHSSPAVFAGKVLTYAEEDDIREVFAPLLAAIQLTADSPEPA